MTFMGETLMSKTFRNLMALFIIAALTMAYGPSIGFAAPGGGGGKAETKCDDGRDNDRDGLTDCADPECYNIGNCGGGIGTGSDCCDMLAASPTL